MAKGLGTLLFVVLAGIGLSQVVGKQSSGSSAGNKIADYCRTNPAKANEVMTSWTVAGVIRQIEVSRITVEDKRWAEIPHDAKVSIAVAGYCHAIAGTSSSAGYVSIRGYRDGQSKGYIVDGNYFD